MARIPAWLCLACAGAAGALALGAPAHAQRAGAEGDRAARAYSGLRTSPVKRSPPPAAARAAAARVARDYGVQLIGVRVVEVGGARVYEATVMNPGGDFDEAFQVTRLLIDPATGKLLPGFRHLEAGHRLSAPSPGQGTPLGPDTGPAARRMSGRN